MQLTKRERWIAIGVGTLVGLFIADRYVRVPYTEWRSEVGVRRDKAEAERDKADHLLAQQKRMQVVWKEMNDNGLKATPADADTQMLAALNEWAQRADIKAMSIKPDRATREGRFEQRSLHAGGTGSMRAVASLLWRMESTPIPVRISELSLTPRKENADDLQIQMTVSTLCLLPESEKGQDRRSTVASAMDARGDRP